MDNNFSFYGMRKSLPEGDYVGKIISFHTQDKVSKAGNNYKTLFAKIEIQSETYILNLSLNPREEGKSTNMLIKQLAEKEGKTADDIIELCNNPQDFFGWAQGKELKVSFNEKGYMDVYDDALDITPTKQAEKGEFVNPDDIPF